MTDERLRNLVFRVSEEEIAMMKAIAAHEGTGIPVAVVVRGWIHREYRARFGDKKPPRPKR